MLTTEKEMECLLEDGSESMESSSEDMTQPMQQQSSGKLQHLRYVAISACIGFTIFAATVFYFSWVSDDIPECRDTSPHVALLERNSVCQDIGVFPNLGTNITIASAFIGGYTELDFVWQNHLQYAKRHGYGYFAPVCDRAFQYGEFQRTSVWWVKFHVVKFLLNKGSDYVFWIDGDSIFTDIDYSLDRLLVSPPKDFVFSGDVNVVFNDGHFMIRNCPWSQSLLRESYRICLAPNWHDNGAFMVYVGGGLPDDRSTWNAAFNKMKHSCISQADAAQSQSTLPTEIQKHVQVLAQDEMNSYDKNNASYILHAAGLAFQMKKKVLREKAPAGDLVSPVPRYVYVEEKDN